MRSQKVYSAQFGFRFERSDLKNQEVMDYLWSKNAPKIKCLNYKEGEPLTSKGMGEKTFLCATIK
jgi:hypothetical protein